VLRKALKSCVLGKWLFGSAFCLWGLYLATVVALYVEFNMHLPVPASALAFGAAMLLVPLATAAIASWPWPLIETAKGSRDKCAER
jgi:hypothetical protein